MNYQGYTEQERYNLQLDAEQSYPVLDIRSYVASKLQLFAVIVYVLSQGYAIPIRAIGPSWAVWPRLDDFAAALLFMVYLFTRSRIYPMDRKERMLFVSWILILLVSVPSTLIGRVVHADMPKGFTFGIFQTFRFFEYGLVWICIRGMAFSSKQFDVISRTFFLVLIFIIMICVGNVTGVLPPARLVSHLPQGPVCGLWRDVHMRTGPSIALGPYSYNASYLGNQLVFMTAIMLGARRPRAPARVLMVIAIGVAIVMSGARAPLVGLCVAIAIWASKTPRQLIAALIIIVFGIVGFKFLGRFAGGAVTERAMERAASIVTEADPTMAGRTTQWARALDIIKESPQIFLMGAGWGFGSWVLLGVGKAHMMLLHVLIELGVFGLLLYSFYLFNIYRLLLGKDRLRRAVRASFLGLMVASLTAETFYPVPAFGGFLGLVFAIVAIARAVERGREIEERSYYEEYELIEQEDEFACQYSV